MAHGIATSNFTVYNPSWLLNKGRVLEQHHVRRNKYEPHCEEVEIIDINPNHARVRHPAKPKQVVLLRDLALLPDKPDHTNENSVLSESLPVESHLSSDTENTSSGSTIVEEAATTITPPYSLGLILSLPPHLNQNRIGCDVLCGTHSQSMVFKPGYRRVGIFVFFRLFSLFFRKERINLCISGYFHCFCQTRQLIYV